MSATPSASLDKATKRGSTSSWNNTPVQDPVQASISQKQLVIQLQQLARDAEHQAALVENANCLQSLVQTLQAIDSETVTIALQTLNIIARTPHHRPILIKVRQLSRSVDLLRQSPNPRIADLARQLHELLQTVSGESSHTLQAPRQLHTIHLRIVNLKTQHDREEIAKLAVRVPGVVSATTDTRTQKATFYTTRDDIRLRLVHSLRSSGFQIDDGDDDGNSVYIDDNVSVASGVGSIYSDFTGPTYAQPSQSFNARTAITRYQPERKVETLRQRLEREKQEREEQELEREQKKESWVGYALSYIW